MILVQFGKGDGEDAAAPMFPMPSENRQRMQRADEGLATGCLLRPHACADHRGPGRRELPRQPNDGLRPEAAGVRGPIRGPRRDLGGEVVKIRTDFAREIEIRQPLLDHHRGHARREDSIRAWPNLDMLVALTRGSRLDRVYAHDARPMSATRFLHEMPVMVARAEEVAAPEDDEAAVGRFLGIETERQPLPGGGDRSNRANSA